MTAALALINYRRAQRLEAARWLQELFREVYLTERFTKVRSTLEYEYSKEVAPLLERRLTNLDIPPTPKELVILEELDALLNYFEFVLTLRRRTSSHGTIARRCSILVQPHEESRARCPPPLRGVFWV